MDDTAAFWPATRLAAALRDRELSSRELLDLYLDRVGRFNAPLNAVVTLDEERARAEAAARDEETAAGRSRGPLHGIPVTIKDALEVGGMRSTGGSPELRDHVPAADAPAVARLRAAGAVVFGKTNVPLWSGDVQTYNEVFGTTSNPWDTGRTPGGSSGGAAVSVACGFTGFELGTDIGGSVRFPSHFTGVFGLKTSYGVVPQRGYLDQVGGGTTDADINVFGPLARSAEDLDLLLGVVAGPPPEQEPAWRLELPAPRTTDLSDLRVAVWLDDAAAPLGTAYADGLRGAADRLADAGAKLTEAHPPVDFAGQWQLFSDLITPAVSPSMGPELGEALGGSHYTWLQLQRRKAELQQVWARWFADYDVLLCPVTITTAFPHLREESLFERVLTLPSGQRPYLDLLAWTGLIGVVGLPAAVPPLGRTADGLPFGAQVVAPYLHDRQAVAAARLFAEVTGGYEPPPAVR